MTTEIKDRTDLLLGSIKEMGNIIIQLPEVVPIGLHPTDDPYSFAYRGVLELESKDYLYEVDLSVGVRYSRHEAERGCIEGEYLYVFGVKVVCNDSGEVVYEESWEGWLIEEIKNRAYNN